MLRINSALAVSFRVNPKTSRSDVAVAAQFGPSTELIQCGNSLADGIWRHRVADEVALCFGAMQLGKSLQLTNTFHTFGDHVEAK